LYCVMLMIVIILLIVNIIVLHHVNKAVDQTYNKASKEVDLIIEDSNNDILPILIYSNPVSDYEVSNEPRIIEIEDYGISEIKIEETIETEIINDIPTTIEKENIEITYNSDSVLTASKGVNYYNGNKETYYNLDMSGCVSIMRNMGNTDEYWVREDGCKMLGNYIMCAANLDVHPRGSLVETSLGTAIVVDTGGFADSNPNQIDIAVNW